MASLTTRRPTFDYPEDLGPSWHPDLPEFACAANAVSLIMPYVEPYIVRAVKQTLPHLEPDLAEVARTYAAQEAAHQAQHIRFNEQIAGRVRGVPTLERIIAATYRWLWRTRSERFHLAYAASSEALAYGIARWVEGHQHEVFAGADPTVTALYLWHLAEEVEHKSVAFDLYDARHKSRWPLAGALFVSIMMLTACVIAGTTLGLIHERRLFSPRSVCRLLKWALGFVFSELPNIVASVLPDHHPSEFVDPTWFSLYLATMGATLGGGSLIRDGVSATVAHDPGRP